MKKYFFLSFTVTSIMLCSWTMKKYNQNSWSISIGKKTLLASWQNNKLGDTAVLEKKNINLQDTLFVTQYLCGYDGENSTTTLTIRNDKGQVINESTNKNNQSIYVAKLSLKDILNSKNYINNQILNIYCSIFSKTDKLDQTLLIGKLQLK